MRNKKLIENKRQKDVIMPEWLTKEPIEIKIKKIYQPKPLRRIAKDKINLHDKQLNKKSQ